MNDLGETFKVAEGIPSEIALNLCYWKCGKRPAAGQEKDPARDGCGLIWYSPLVPMKPSLVRCYIEMVEETCTEHGIEPLITLTSLSSLCFDSTVPLLFDRNNPEETDRARRCYRDLFEKGRREGLLPYRLGVDHMGLAVEVDAPAWDLAARIKKAVDPAGIMAPGRYSPGSS